MDAHLQEDARLPRVGGERRLYGHGPAVLRSARGGNRDLYEERDGCVGVHDPEVRNRRAIRVEERDGPSGGHRGRQEGHRVRGRRMARPPERELDGRAAVPIPLTGRAELEEPRLRDLVELPSVRDRGPIIIRPSAAEAVDRTGDAPALRVGRGPPDHVEEAPDRVVEVHVVAADVEGIEQCGGLEVGYRRVARGDARAPARERVDDIANEAIPREVEGSEAPIRQAYEPVLGREGVP